MNRFQCSYDQKQLINKPRVKVDYKSPNTSHNPKKPPIKLMDLTSNRVVSQERIVADDNAEAGGNILAPSFLPSRIKMELEHQASCPNVMVWRRKNLLHSQFVFIKSEQSKRQNVDQQQSMEKQSEMTSKRTLSQWKKAVNQPLSLRTILAENFPVINPDTTKEGTSTQKFQNSKSLPKISFVDTKQIQEHNSILAKKKQSTKRIGDNYDISSITHSTETFNEQTQGSFEAISQNQYSGRKPVLLKKHHQHQKSTVVQKMNFDYDCYTQQSQESYHKSKLNSPNIPRSQYWKSSNSIACENQLNTDQKPYPNNLKKKEEFITVADQNQIQQMQDELESRRRSLMKKQQSYQEFSKGNKYQLNKSQKPLGIGHLFKLPKQELVMSAVKERYSGENENCFNQSENLLRMSIHTNQMTGSSHQMVNRPECLLQSKQAKPSFASQLQEAITRNLRGLKENEGSLIRGEAINPSFNTILQPTTFMLKRKEATEQGTSKRMDISKGAASFSNIDMSKIHTQQQFFKAVKEIQKTKESNYLRESQQKILKNIFVNSVSKPQVAQSNEYSEARNTLRANQQFNNRSLAEREEQAFQAMQDQPGFDIEPWNYQPEEQQQLIPIAETKETFTTTTLSQNITRQTHMKSNQILYGQHQSSYSHQSRHITPSNSASQIVTQPASKLKHRYYQF